jgi:2-iminobutanoate/2-iminopropanoate deaminase
MTDSEAHVDPSSGIRPLSTPSVHAVGPYSPAMRAGDWIVCSGQIGIDTTTGKVVDGGLVAQAGQALANLTAVLRDCGCDWTDVAKVNLFVATDGAAAMPEVNALYEATLGSHRPARSTVGVAWLPMGTLFEVEAWAFKPERSNRG